MGRRGSALGELGEREREREREREERERERDRKRNVKCRLVSREVTWFITTRCPSPPPPLETWRHGGGCCTSGAQCRGEECQMGDGVKRMVIVAQKARLHLLVDRESCPREAGG